MHFKSLLNSRHWLKICLDILSKLFILKRGEFLSNKFDLFCKHHGIRRQVTIRTPQQNGIAERKNQTIVEMTRSTLDDKTLLNDYSAKFVVVAVHILNISRTKAVRTITPYEAWFRKKPNVNH